MIAYKKTVTGFTFKVVVQPRSSVNAIIGSHDQALKIKLTAPPVGGAANKQCIGLLAKNLGLPKSAFKIVSGRASRRKKIGISLPSGWENQKEVNLILHWLKTLAENSS
jgi:uncharacterized protein (TIGR00251 family)